MANISQRATVIIGKDGKVAWVKVEPDITKERDYSEVKAVLEGLRSRPAGIDRISQEEETNMSMKSENGQPDFRMDSADLYREESFTDSTYWHHPASKPGQAGRLSRLGSPDRLHGRDAVVDLGGRPALEL